MARINFSLLLLSILLFTACGSESKNNNSALSSSVGTGTENGISSAATSSSRSSNVRSSSLPSIASSNSSQSLSSNSISKSSLSSISLSSNSISSSSLSSSNVKNSSSFSSKSSSSSSNQSSTKSSESSSSKRSSVANVTADIKVATGTKDSRLACYKGAGEKACNLRTYQIMVESFIDGDNNANMNAGYGTSHHKGDLQGIINSLDYIKSLGINAIWITPVFESVNNGSPSQLDGTGYFASNYFKVDPHFGTSAKLTELVDSAHAKGLYVFLDGVFGHFKSNANSFQSPTGKTISGSSVANYPTDLEFFKEVARYWITNFKIDGWRLDQAYQVPVKNLADIRAAVEAASATVTYENSEGDMVNPLGYMVAEIWKGGSEINSFAYGATSSAGLLSAFDFPLRYKLVQTLAVEESGAGKSPASNLNAGYKEQSAYSPHAMPNLMLGNHDLVRFGDLIQRGNLGNPDSDNYFKRHKAAMSFLTEYSGPITLYYGDEIGQEVKDFSTKINSNCSNLGLCDDHVSRDSAIIEGIPTTIGAKASELTPRQADLKLHVKNLLQMRENHPALWNGTRTHIHSNANIFIDRKDKGADNVLYALNTTDKTINFSIAATAIGSDGDLVDLLNGTTYTKTLGVYHITLTPFEGIFLDIITPTIDGPQTGNGDSIEGSPLADCTRTAVEGNDPIGKTMFIRGSYLDGNNFGATPTSRQFVYTGDNIYQVKVNEPSTTSYAFKFADTAWTNEFAVQGAAPVQIGTPQEMAVASGAGTESTIAIPEPGTYVFSFEINANKNGGNMMVSKCP